MFFLLLHWQSRLVRFSPHARVVLLGLTLLLSFPLSAQDHLLPVFHFQREQGFPPRYVSAHAFRDSFGFVWIGTDNGLERFDGYVYKEYRNVANDPHSLSSHRIQSLLLDSKQRLWVGTMETGLCLYDRSHDSFLNLYPYPGDSSSEKGRNTWTIAEDRSGDLWLATDSGVVHVGIPAGVGSNDLDSLARALHFRRLPLGTALNEAYDVCERKDGKILVASDSGLIILDPTTYALSRPYWADPLGHRLDSLRFRCLLQGSDGNLWLGARTEGVFRIEWESARVTNYRHHDGDSLSIRVDDIWDLAEDRSGNFWIGTARCIDLLSPAKGHCIQYLTYGPKPWGAQAIRLSFDPTGTLWIGAGQSLWRLSPRSQLFPHFSLRNQDGSPRGFDAIERSLDGNVWCFSKDKLFQIDIKTRKISKTINVYGGTQPHHDPMPNRTASLHDSKGNFWYAAYDNGLYKVNLATGRIKNYRFETPVGKLNRVRSLAQGSGDSLWIGCVTQGLMKFDPASGRFLRTPFANAANVIKDHDGKIWVATEGLGLDVHDPATGTTNHFVHDPSNPGSLSHNLVWSTYEDPSGRIWVNAGNVLNLWDPVTRSFTRFPNLAFNEAEAAIPLGSDRKGRLWILYFPGDLSILDPLRDIFTDFETSGGISGFICDMENLEDGRVLLAGGNGLNILSPDSLDAHRPPPPLVITRMAINDESVPPPPFLNGSGPLRLSHTQDVLEFEFAAIDIDAPQLVRYQYQLEGLERDWVKPKDRRYVRYTALSPGDYVFKVRVASSRGEWPDREISLAVNISPPWWRTTWAYATYVLLFLGLVNAGYRIRLRQVHLQQEMEMEHFQREHLAELDRLKSRFFANISHEFRTPLTLILGPLEKLRFRFPDEESQIALGMMKRNAHQLLRLVNQLLDLSKLEAGGMKLQACRANIVPVVNGVAYSFESSAGMRKIHLRVSTEQDEIQVFFDRDKLEKILTNLLSNAFKFTPDGGNVVVTLTPSPSLQMGKGDRGGDGSSGIGGGFLEISVSDSGIGISEDKLPHIFDRFYQVDDSTTREQGGTGIGLALVKELVELHHGTIRVTSQPGVGTEFTVSLPLGREHLKSDEIVEGTGKEEMVMSLSEAVREGTVSAQELRAPPDHDTRKCLVLIVEDNADVRQYIKDNLPASYSVLEAKDGVEGIEKAKQTIPDLIVSDVMMPKKDGYELCRALKNDEKTSHIPIILLTAKAASENKIEGLETGADDYLIKPFEPKELLARVKNLIDMRRKLRERFNASVPLKPGEVAVTSIDDAFLTRVMRAVEQHMGDDHFHIGRLGADVGMSRAQLHRKLVALTNQSPGEFIRYIRLHRGMQLLQKDAGTVSEIAYTVGFSDPSYFSKCFHKQFGKAPTDVKKTPVDGKTAGTSSLNNF
jgi:signal transduction histidine kinase/DNA-binding response OmpR family regulator/ligand-binding sensor domain-containing protein